MNPITDLMVFRYAVQLAETGSFRRAAEACRVTQPTISIQVKRLEESLGYDLFERTPRGVHPTPAGEAFLARARELLNHWEHLFAQGEKDSPGSLAGPLSLGVIPTLGPYLLPPLCTRLRRESPGLRLTLLEEQTAPLVHRLLRGQLDCAVVALPVQEETLAGFELALDPFLVVTRRTRRKALLQDRLSPAALPRDGLLLLSDGHCLRGQTLEVCGLRSTAELQVEGSSFATLLNLIEADEEGESYTLLPASARQEMTSRPKLRALRFASPAPFRTLGLVLRRSSPWVPAAPQLAAHLREALRPLLGKEKDPAPAAPTG